MTTPDIAALCAALDDGDDSALPALADALEEAGDPRAAGVRAIGTFRKRPGPLSVGTDWVWHAGPPTGWPAGWPAGRRERKDIDPDGIVPRAVYDRLRHWGESSAEWNFPLGNRLLLTTRAYCSRSAAFLALAEALAEALK